MSWSNSDRPTNSSNLFVHDCSAKEVLWAAAHTPAITIYNSYHNLHLYFSPISPPWCIWYIYLTKFVFDSWWWRICNTWIVSNKILFHFESNSFPFQTKFLKTLNWESFRITLWISRGQVNSIVRRKLSKTILLELKINPGKDTFTLGLIHGSLWSNNRNRVSNILTPANLSVLFGISSFSSIDSMEVRVYWIWLP